MDDNTLMAIAIVVFGVVGVVHEHYHPADDAVMSLVLAGITSILGLAFGRRRANNRKDDGDRNE